MHGKPYSLFRRNRIYYCRFKLPNGSWSTAKSTKETAKGRAEAWAITYLREGSIVLRENVTLAEFSKNFFDWDGPWATNKRITGKRISPHHCQDCVALLINHILPRLGHMRLSAIKEPIIEKLRNDIYKHGYSGNTTNRVLLALKTILKAAKKQSLIQFVPEVESVADRPKQKGMLTIEEVKRLFSIQWMSDPAHCHPSKENFCGYAGNLLAACSGLRMGEMQALTLRDIHLDSGYIRVWRSWDKLFGLNQTTKTGKERNIFIPKAVQDILSQLIQMNSDPRNQESFLFFSETPGKPIESKLFTRSFYTALKQIGIDESQRKERNITFHSWRYFFNSLLVNAKVPLQKIQSLTGHLTNEMTQHYYHVDDMTDVLRTVQDALFPPSKL